MPDRSRHDPHPPARPARPARRRLRRGALLTKTPEDGSPAIRLSPTSLVFEDAGSEVVTVESVGGGPLTVSEVSLALEGAFSVSAPDGDLPGVLESGDAAELVVTWDGTEAEDELQVLSDDPTLALARVDLLGLGDGGGTGGEGDDTGDITDDTGGGGDDGEELLPAMSLSPSTWSAGTVALGSSVTQTFTVSSTGTGDLELTAVSVSGAGFALDTALSLPQTVAAGDTLALVVSFSPSSTGAASGALQVEGTDVATASASLSGDGEDVDPYGAYTWTGSAQSYTVPSGVTSVTIKAWGAGGGAGNETGRAAGTGGGGGYAEATVSVTGGEVLTVRPGQGGIAPGGGGGASIVSRADGTLLVVAGGGGGTDGGSASGGVGTGGAAGGATGATGASMVSSTWGSGTGGQGGSQSAGGSGGLGAVVTGSGNPCDGAAGSYLQGGGGAWGWSTCSTATAAVEDAAGTGQSNGAGGGGGAGYYGGGGGGSPSTYYGGGGGGGSSWSTTGTVVAGSGSTAANTGDADHDGSAGAGGLPGVWPTTTSTDGEPGRVVIQ